MSRQRILVTVPYLNAGDDIDERLRAEGFEPVYSHWHVKRTEDELISLLEDIDGVIAWGDPFTARVLEAAPRLKAISRTGAGYDTIDMSVANARRIIVSTTPGANRKSVAEYAFGLMLILARKMMQNLSEVPNRRWGRYQGIDLAGKRLGIIGLGSIGKEVARRARGFEMEVLAYDLYQDHAFAAQHQVRYVALEQLLRESDFVSLHLNLDESSYHLINAERLLLMKPTAYLVNTARGGIVDTAALYVALKEKRIAGAALDAFEEEPPTGTPLLELDNILMSPHVAGGSIDAQKMIRPMAAENVMLALQGKRPHHIVNPEVLDSSLR